MTADLWNPFENDKRFIPKSGGAYSLLYTRVAGEGRTEVPLPTAGTFENMALAVKAALSIIRAHGVAVRVVRGVGK